MKNYNPELLSLSLVEWQLFGTFTFRSERISERVRPAMIFALLRILAHNSGLHFKDLMWVVRDERGEQFGRRHYHVLIAGLPSHWKNWATCNSVEKIWRKMGGGHPKVSVYINTLDGVDYILKKGDEMARSIATRYAGGYHEFTKFGGSCDLTLSESVCAYILQRHLHGRWGRGPVRQVRRLLGETGRLSTEQSEAGVLTVASQSAGETSLNLSLPLVG